MKGFVLWIAAIFFLYLAITAVNMGEYGIAVGMGVIAFGCVWAAPSAAKSKKSKSRAGR